jgi:hypothetical protein
MNILDENILVSQRQLLRRWRITSRQIGDDAGRAGMKDEEVLALLTQLPRPTFFTRDLGFYQRRLCHQRYCVVCLAVEQEEVAFFIRRLLRHPACRTRAQRMGAIVRASARGLTTWRLQAAAELVHSWGEG